MRLTLGHADGRSSVALSLVRQVYAPWLGSIRCSERCRADGNTRRVLIASTGVGALPTPPVSQLSLMGRKA
jgi:hypothetical protein